jgi:hypothetical protein
MVYRNTVRCIGALPTRRVSSLLDRSKRCGTHGQTLPDASAAGNQERVPSMQKTIRMQLQMWLVQGVSVAFLPAQVDVK